MFTRTLQLAVPSVAMAVVGFAMFGPGAVRSFDAAQLRGGPTEGVRRLSLRVLGVERFRGIDSTKDLGPVVVRVRMGGVESAARCTTRRDGTCDVDLALPSEAHGAIHAEVTTEDGRVSLASGDVARDASGWAKGPLHPRLLTGTRRGDLTVDVEARRGVFAAPFRDELVVTVKRADSPARGAKITLRTDAAQIAGALDGAPSATLTASERGEATFALEPRTHTAEATIEAKSAGLGGSWEGLLPVIPGAIWLDPTDGGGEMRIVSPVLRDVAFATLSSRAARLWGGVVPLAPDDRGFAVGTLDRSLAGVDPLVPVWLTLSSDPRASGSGTVGWPVNRAALSEGELAFRDWLLLDGMPAAEQRDAERRGHARQLAAWALGAAAVIEGVLLGRGSYGKGARSFAWLVVAIATVALAFAALGLVAMWKTG
jgi:hypothetical protein